MEENKRLDEYLLDLRAQNVLRMMTINVGKRAKAIERVIAYMEEEPEERAAHVVAVTEWAEEDESKEKLKHAKYNTTRLLQAKGWAWRQRTPAIATLTAVERKRKQDTLASLNEEESSLTVDIERAASDEEKRALRARMDEIQTDKAATRKALNESSPTKKNRTGGVALLWHKSVAQDITPLQKKNLKHNDSPMIQLRLKHRVDAKEETIVTAIYAPNNSTRDRAAAFWKQTAKKLQKATEKAALNGTTTHHVVMGDMNDVSSPEDRENSSLAPGKDYAAFRGDLCLADTYRELMRESDPTERHFSYFASRDGKEIRSRIDAVLLSATSARLGLIKVKSAVVLPRDTAISPDHAPVTADLTIQTLPDRCPPKKAPERENERKRICLKELRKEERREKLKTALKTACAEGAAAINRAETRAQKEECYANLIASWTSALKETLGEESVGGERINEVERKKRKIAERIACRAAQLHKIEEARATAAHFAGSARALENHKRNADDRGKTAIPASMAALRTNQIWRASSLSKPGALTSQLGCPSGLPTRDDEFDRWNARDFKVLSQELAKIYNRESEALRKERNARESKLIMSLTEKKQRSNPQKDWKRFWRYAKPTCTQRKGIRSVKVTDPVTGKTISSSEPQDINDKLTSFWSELFRTRMPSDPANERHPQNTYRTQDWTKTAGFKRIQTVLSQRAREITAPIDEPTVRHAIEKTKKGTAAGPDEIPPDLFDYLPQEGIALLARLFSDIAQGQEDASAPEGWRKAFVYLIYKNGDSEEPSNYRPISLLSTVYKLFTSIIATRLSSLWESAGLWSAAQGGFRPQRGTLDKLDLLLNTIEYANEEKSPLYTTYLDLRKAFDSVEPTVILATLSAMGFDARALRLIEDLYSRTTSAVLTPTGACDAFSTTRGVRQGDGLSPFLFNLVLEPLFHWLEESETGFEVSAKIPQENSSTPSTHTHRVTVNAYADDICLTAGSRRDAQRQLRMVAQFFNYAGLTIATDPAEAKIKQKTVHTCNQAGLEAMKESGIRKEERHLEFPTTRLTLRRNPETGADEPVSEEEIVLVPFAKPKRTYRYLGVLVTHDGTWRQEQKHLVTITKQFVGYLQTTCLTSDQCLALLNAVLAPKLRYILDVATGDQRLGREIDQVVSRMMYRKMGLDPSLSPLYLNATPPQGLGLFSAEAYITQNTLTRWQRAALSRDPLTPHVIQARACRLLDPIYLTAHTSTGVNSAEQRLHAALILSPHHLMTNAREHPRIDPTAASGRGAAAQPEVSRMKDAKEKYQYCGTVETGSRRLGTPMVKWTRQCAGPRAWEAVEAISSIRSLEGKPDSEGDPSKTGDLTPEEILILSKGGIVDVRQLLMIVRPPRGRGNGSPVRVETTITDARTLEITEKERATKRHWNANKEQVNIALTKIRDRLAPGCTRLQPFFDEEQRAQALGRLPVFIPNPCAPARPDFPKSVSLLNPLLLLQLGQWEPTVGAPDDRRIYHVFTDGSEKDGRVACAVVFCPHKDGPWRQSDEQPAKTPEDREKYHGLPMPEEGDTFAYPRALRLPDGLSNNTAELAGILLALLIARVTDELRFGADSTNALSKDKVHGEESASLPLHPWQRTPTTHVDRDLICEIQAILRIRESYNTATSFVHVPSHLLEPNHPKWAGTNGTQQRLDKVATLVKTLGPIHAERYQRGNAKADRYAEMARKAPKPHITTWFFPRGPRVDIVSTGPASRPPTLNLSSARGERLLAPVAASFSSPPLRNTKRILYMTALVARTEEYLREKYWKQRKAAAAPDAPGPVAQMAETCPERLNPLHVLAEDPLAVLPLEKHLRPTAHTKMDRTYDYWTKEAQQYIRQESETKKKDISDRDVHEHEQTERYKARLLRKLRLFRLLELSTIQKIRKNGFLASKLMWTAQCKYADTRCPMGCGQEERHNHVITTCPRTMRARHLISDGARALLPKLFSSESQSRYRATLIPLLELIIDGWLNPIRDRQARGHPGLDTNAATLEQRRWRLGLRLQEVDPWLRVHHDHYLLREKQALKAFEQLDACSNDHSLLLYTPKPLVELLTCKDLFLKDDWSETSPRHLIWRIQHDVVLPQLVKIWADRHVALSSRR